MQPIVLEGHNLSLRHRNLNLAVTEAFKNKIPFEEVLTKVGNTDIDNIYKIDLASKNRNVDYIIKNLKSTDGLHVARALNADWLFTDNQYSHMINPTYINTELFPYMSDKSKEKFMSKLIYHLKDEKRCEDFYTYYKEQANEKYMGKFIMKCSIEFIKDTMMAYTDLNVIPDYMYLLCFKSPELAELYVTKKKRVLNQDILYSLRSLIDNQGEFYLKLLEKNVAEANYITIRMGQRITRQILRNHRHRFLKNPHFYFKILHVDHVLFTLTQDELKGVATQFESEGNFWNDFIFKKIVNKIKNNKLEFLKNLFEKHYPGESFEMSNHYVSYGWYEYLSDEQREKWALQRLANRNEDLRKLYEWYRFIKFDISFIEIKKLLQSEPDAKERERMFGLLVKTCDSEEANIMKLLKYFHDRHINETIEFKLNIIEKIAVEKKVYKCGDEVWNILNEILLSMRMYEAVHECNYGFLSTMASQLMAHHIIHGKSTPENVIKLFEDHFTNLDMMINTPWKEKVFFYLKLWILEKISEGENSNSDSGFQKVQIWTYNLTCLLKAYGHPLDSEMISLIRRIREKDSNFFSECTSNRDYRELFFPEQCMYGLNQDICLQILKKDISLLHLCKAGLNHKIQSDEMTFKRLLSKIRVYFSNDLAIEWKKYYLDKLNENHKDPKGCACVVFGLTILLPAAEYEKLITKYQPTKAKLVWSETDPCLVHIQNNIAKLMYLVRPTVNYEYLLSFARGDYLKFAIPSIMSLNRQLPQEQCRELIGKLILSPISVQKHGIRLANWKYTNDELLDLFNKLWDKTNNVSMKKLIFTSVHKLLVNNEYDGEYCLKIWDVLKVFLEQLKGNEHLDKIVNMYSNRVNGTNILVSPLYCTAYWHLLQTVPGSSEIQSYWNTILSDMSERNIFDNLEEAFLKQVIEKLLVDELFSCKKDNSLFVCRNEMWSLVSLYVIRYEISEIAERRSTVLKSIIDFILSNWDIEDIGEMVKKSFCDFVRNLLWKSQEYLIDNYNLNHNPFHIFEFIYQEINKKLCKVKYYQYFIWFRLSKTLLNTLTDELSLKPDMRTAEYRLQAELFGKKSIELMKTEIAANYPAVPHLFAYYYLLFINNFVIYKRDEFYKNLAETFLADTSDINSCILGLDLLLKACDEDEIKNVQIIERVARMNVPQLGHYLETKVKQLKTLF